jgi:hypothetical protein
MFTPTKHRALWLVLSVFLLAPLSGAAPDLDALFNGQLSAGEKAAILQGEVVIRNIGKAKNMSIRPEAHPAAARAVGVITSLKPSYLAEVIQVRPYEESLLWSLREILADVPSYQGIPYYSVRHERYFDLYSSALVTGKAELPGATVI